MVLTMSPAEEPDRDLLAEECMSFAQAARRLPPVRGTKRMAPSTLFRWATVGRLSLGGKRVYLETVRVGGTNCTSMQALARFFRALNDCTAAKKSRKQKSAEKKVDKAKEILRRRGLL